MIKKQSILDGEDCKETYYTKLCRLHNIKANSSYMCEVQFVKFILLLLNTLGKGSKVSFSVSDILDNTPYFISSNEGCCVSDSNISEALAKHILSLLYILDYIEIQDILLYNGSLKNE